MKKNKVITALIFLFLVLIIGLHIHSSMNIEIKSISLQKVIDADLEGITLEGEIIVSHGGFIPLPLDDVEYELRSLGQDKILARGHVKGKTLSPLSEKNLTFRTKIFWVQAGNVFQEAIVTGNMPVKVNADAKIVSFGSNSLVTEYEDVIDIYPYVKDAIEERISSLLVPIIS